MVGDRAPVGSEGGVKRASQATPRVIAGLVPATPIVWHGGASISGVAGTSPAMTVRI